MYLGAFWVGGNMNSKLIFVGGSNDDEEKFWGLPVLWLETWRYSDAS